MYSCNNIKQEQKTTTNKPNVLFISIDDLNNWVGLLKDAGHPDVKTPNIDKLASRGVYFSNAHANTTACTPSRLSIMTGVSAVNTGCYSNSSGMANDSVFSKIPLLPTYFRNNGYYTMGGGKIEGHACKNVENKFPNQVMWDERLPRTFLMDANTFKDGGHYGGIDFYPFPMDGSPIKKQHPNYIGHSLCAGPIDRDSIPGGKMPDELTADWAIKKLEKDYDKPFFLGVGFIRPHVPYTAPRKYFDMYPLDKIYIPKVEPDEMSDIPLYGKAMTYGLGNVGDEFMVREIGEQYRKKLIQGYLASISFMDDQVGRVINALNNSKYAKNTIIVLWSDHGQHLGEKRRWRKMCLWNESSNSPMLWVVPGITKGNQICKQAVSLMDIYPTLAQVCNFKPIKNQDGISLLPQLKNPNKERKNPVIITWTYGSHAVRDNHWHYIHYFDNSEELYDCINDPEQHNNLAKNTKYTKEIKRLKEFIPKDKYKLTERNKDFFKYKKLIDRWTKNNINIPEWLR